MCDVQCGAERRRRQRGLRAGQMPGKTDKRQDSQGKSTGTKDLTARHGWPDEPNMRGNRCFTIALRELTSSGRRRRPTPYREPDDVGPVTALNAKTTTSPQRRLAAYFARRRPMPMKRKDFPAGRATAPHLEVSRVHLIFCARLSSSRVPTTLLNTIKGAHHGQHCAGADQCF